MVILWNVPFCDVEQMYDLDCFCFFLPQENNAEEEESIAEVCLCVCHCV